MKKTKKTKSVGIEVEFPKKKCDDKHCPFHNNLKLRGRIFKGTVLKAKATKTAVIEWNRPFYIKKYERYENRISKLQAHNPPCIDAKEGDQVKIMECKPISKTKKFVIIEK